MTLPRPSNMPADPAPSPDVPAADTAAAPRAALLEDNRRRHWHLNRILVAALLVVWLVVTFLVSYHARALDFRFFGWPFSFWMAAQGALLVYLLLVVVYAVVMNRLDRRFDLHEED